MRQPTESLAEAVEVKVVGKSGQISLGKRFAGKTLRLERRTDGTVLITAVAMVPEHQLWTLDEPHRSSIERGLAWAAQTEPRETDIGGLLQRDATRAGRRRGRRTGTPRALLSPMDSGVILRPMGDLPTPARPATYDDLLALPDHVVGEIVGGELHVSPRPAPRHAVASSVLGGHLGPPYHQGQGGPGGWWILFEPELHLSAHVVVPDLAGWRRTRMPTIPDTAYFETAPDWICEVLSPRTAQLDRHGKLDVYARAGVAHAWLVDPLARTLEALQLEHGRWVILAVLAGDNNACLPPFTDITIPLASLWAD